MKVMELLYKYYDPWIKHPDVFQHNIQEDAIINLRPFFIPDDFHLYNEWINDEITTGKKLQSTLSVFSENYFIAVLESSNAQSLWGTINGEPAFEADFYKAVEYHTPDYIKGVRLTGDDIIMQLIISPQVLKGPDELARYILPACLGHITNCSGSERVFLVTDRNDQLYNQLAINANPISKSLTDKSRQVYCYKPVLLL